MTKPTLSTFSLVCHYYLVPARTCLFHKVTVSGKISRFQAFLSRDPAPVVLRYIHSLELHPSVKAMESDVTVSVTASELHATILSKLPALETLYLNGTRLKCNILGADATPSAPEQVNLVQVKLQQVIWETSIVPFGPRRSLIELLSVFGSVQTLELNNVGEVSEFNAFGQNSDAFVSEQLSIEKQIPLVRVEKLICTADIHRAILRLIKNAIHPRSLRSLELRGFLAYQINSFLDTCCQYATSLHLVIQEPYTRSEMVRLHWFLLG